MTTDSSGIDRVQRLVGPDYRVHFVIGHGGMSTVWLATDRHRGTDVAIKVLRPEFSDNAEFLARFRNEARAAQSIESNNIVATYDYREADDAAGTKFCFIVMEYVRGESLADMIKRLGSIGEEAALDVLEQAAYGLAVMHHMGFVHRDIKPGNILISENGTVKLTDFGIAKAAEAVPLTRTGMVVGTVHYVSPEQAQGSRVSPTSDIYSLGVVGYEMLCGHRPFRGESSVSVALAHINSAPLPLPSTIDPHIQELIYRCLDKNPQQRYADGNELSHAISAVRLGQRPPRPRSAAVAGRAPSYDDTQSTRLLADAIIPTTVAPAAEPHASMLPAAERSGSYEQGRTPNRRPTQAPQKQATRRDEHDSHSSSSRGIAGWVILSVILILVLGGVVYAAMTSLGGSDAPSTPSHSPVVTQTVTSTVDPDPEQQEPQVPETSSSHRTLTLEPTETDEPQEPDAKPTREPSAPSQSDPKAPKPAPKPTDKPADSKPAPTQPEGGHAGQAGPGVGNGAGNGPGTANGNGNGNAHSNGEHSQPTHRQGGTL